MSSLNRQHPSLQILDGNCSGPAMSSKQGGAVSLEQVYWRSLEDLANSPEVEKYLGAEFPQLQEAFARSDRRGFLRLLGASIALAGISSTGCRRWPVEELRPHTSSPAGSSPGVPEYFATMFELDGIATGVLAKSYDGRPIKIEGNPDHPASLGAASALAQASVLELYDPDRSRQLRQRVSSSAPASSVTSDEARLLNGKANSDLTRSERTWKEFQTYAENQFATHRARKGEGLAILMQPSSSPTERRIIDEIKQSMPNARWFAYQPIHHDHAWQGARAAFGRTVRCQYDLTKAQTILCVNADLLGTHPAHVKLAHDWAAGRRNPGAGAMNRLISIEAGWTLTGTVADVRIPLTPTQIETAVKYIAIRLGVRTDDSLPLEASTARRLDAVAQDLRQAKAASLVVGGPSLSPEAHQWIHVINDHLGGVGASVVYTPEPLADDALDGCIASIRQLSELLKGNVLRTLIILGGNPAYDAPVDAQLDLSSTPSRPLVSIHLSLHDNETSQACTWHLPAAHALERWSDGRAWDGTYTLGQPLILPLFNGKSPIELLSLALGKPVDNARSAVRDTFSLLFPDAGAKGWEVALHNGLQAGSTFEPIASLKPALPAVPGNAAPSAAVTSESGFAVQFIPDAKVHDGRFVNNAWLQELPDPITKLTWENAAWISKADADRLRLEIGDEIKVVNNRVKNASIEIPVLIVPGQPAGCLTLPLGYGRTSAGRIGDGLGANAFSIRSSDESYIAHDCTVSKTGRRHKLATTQLHHLVRSVADFALQARLGDKGKPGLLVHEALLSDYRHDPHALHGQAHAVHAAPLFDPPISFDSPHRWGMAIDLNACIGCSACVVACQAENNIPVVGKDNVAVNREMHWLRIDRYFKGSIEEPDIVHVPVACVHCENAPCEQVCPVAATVHDAEGLNVMVYNRCIGTRYCENNCPYKVRRFNYFDFVSTDPREPAKPWLGIPDRQVEEVSTWKRMVHNPTVTVRMRGVMEKCTYCVQRIVDARAAARDAFARGERESDLIQGGEVKTACQATCPTQAIVFGDLNDPESAVSKARKNDRSYEMLEELNLRARTTYLGKIRNRDV